MSCEYEYWDIAISKGIVDLPRKQFEENKLGKNGNPHKYVIP